MRAQNGNNIGRRRITGSEEVPANAKGEGEVDLVSVPGVLLGGCGESGNHAGEVEQNQRGKDLLFYERGLFGMKGEQAKGVFEGAKGGFDAPAEVIEPLERIRRERVLVQVGDDGFIRVVGEFETNHAKEDRIKRGLIHIKEIEGARRGQEAVQRGVLFDGVGLLAGENAVDIQIPLRGRRQIQPREDTLVARDIFDADEVVKALALNMGEHIVALIAAIGEEDGVVCYGGAVFS